MVLLETYEWFTYPVVFIRFYTNGTFYAEFITRFYIHGIVAPVLCSLIEHVSYIRTEVPYEAMTARMVVLYNVLTSRRNTSPNRSKSFKSAIQIAKWMIDSGTDVC